MKKYNVLHSNTEWKGSIEGIEKEFSAFTYETLIELLNAEWESQYPSNTDKLYVSITSEESAFIDISIVEISDTEWDAKFNDYTVLNYSDNSHFDVFNQIYQVITSSSPAQFRSKEDMLSLPSNVVYIPFDEKSIINEKNENELISVSPSGSDTYSESISEFGLNVSTSYTIESSASPLSGNEWTISNWNKMNGIGDIISVGDNTLSKKEIGYGETEYSDSNYGTWYHDFFLNNENFGYKDTNYALQFEQIDGSVTDALVFSNTTDLNNWKSWYKPLNMNAVGHWSSNSPRLRGSGLYGDFPGLQNWNSDRGNTPYRYDNGRTYFYRPNKELRMKSGMLFRGDGFWNYGYWTLYPYSKWGHGGPHTTWPGSYGESLPATNHCVRCWMHPSGNYLYHRSSEIYKNYNIVFRARNGWVNEGNKEWCSLNFTNTPYCQGNFIVFEMASFYSNSKWNTISLIRSPDNIWVIYNWLQTDQRTFYHTTLNDPTFNGRSVWPEYDWTYSKVIKDGLTFKIWYSTLGTGNYSHYFELDLKDFLLFDSTKQYFSLGFGSYRQPMEIYITSANTYENTSWLGNAEDNSVWYYGSSGWYKSSNKLVDIVGTNVIRSSYDGNVYRSSSIVKQDTNIENDKWYHMVMSSNGTDISLRVNQELSSETVPTSGIVFGDGYSFGNFNGMIDEIWMFNEDITTYDKDQLYYLFSKFYVRRDFDYKNIKKDDISFIKTSSLTSEELKIAKFIVTVNPKVSFDVLFDVFDKSFIATRNVIDFIKGMPSSVLKQNQGDVKVNKISINKDVNLTEYNINRSKKINDFKDLDIKILNNRYESNNIPVNSFSTMKKIVVDKTPVVIEKMKEHQSIVDLTPYKIEKETVYSFKEMLNEQYYQKYSDLIYNKTHLNVKEFPIIWDFSNDTLSNSILSPKGHLNQDGFENQNKFIPVDINQSFSAVETFIEYKDKTTSKIYNTKVQSLDINTFRSIPSTITNISQDISSKSSVLDFKTIVKDKSSKLSLNNFEVIYKDPSFKNGVDFDIIPFDSNKEFSTKIIRMNLTDIYNMSNIKLTTVKPIELYDYKVISVYSFPDDIFYVDTTKEMNKFYKDKFGDNPHYEFKSKGHQIKIKDSFDVKSQILDITQEVKTPIDTTINSTVISPNEVRDTKVEPLDKYNSYVRETVVYPLDKFIEIKNTEVKPKDSLINFNILFTRSKPRIVSSAFSSINRTSRDTIIELKEINVSAFDIKQVETSNLHIEPKEKINISSIEAVETFEYESFADAHYDKEAIQEFWHGPWKTILLVNPQQEENVKILHPDFDAQTTKLFDGKFSEFCASNLSDFTVEHPEKVYSMTPDVSGNITATWEWIWSDGFRSNEKEPCNIHNGFTDALVFDTEVEALEMVNDSSNEPPTMKDVFTTWEKIQRDNIYTEEELNNTWAWDDVRELAYTTLNSATHIGFVSPFTDDNFYLQARVFSTCPWDNDLIGLIIAYNSGNFLMAVRNTGGVRPQWGIVSIDATTFHITTVVDGTDKVKDGNGLPWLNYGEGVRIRIERNGDIIKCYTSDFSSSGMVQPLNESTELVIDLNELGLDEFKGEQQWGFVSYSQEYSYLADIETNGAGTQVSSNMIFSIDTQKVWLWSEYSNSWVLQTSKTPYDFTGVDRIVYDTSDGDIYFMSDTGIVKNPTQIDLDITLKSKYEGQEKEITKNIILDI